MSEIRHRVGISAPLTDVYDALSTPEGVATWWTRDASGDTSIGGKLAVGFGGPEPGAIFELTELSAPDRPSTSGRVVWRCIEGPSEWPGTTIQFDLGRQDDETVVVFTHAGWQEPVEFMHHCSTSWAYYLISLKHAVGGGQATPWPDNERISTWG
jgi:uncharacterized protein YndB with AHSA1/START domain